MTTFVFDTGALSLIYAEDMRLRPILEKIQSGSAEGLVSAVTLSEFYYKTCHTFGKVVAALRSRQVSERMRIIQAGAEVSVAAGLEKCRNHRLSLADAFVLALAQDVKGTLLTTDGELAKERGAEVRYLAV